MEIESEYRTRAVKDGSASSDAHKKQLKELNDEIEKRRVVVGGIDQQVQANQVLVVAQKTAAEANLDNATRVDYLRERYTQMAAALDIVRQSVANGTMAQEQANIVERDAADGDARHRTEPRSPTRHHQLRAHRRLDRQSKRHSPL